MTQEPGSPTDPRSVGARRVGSSLEVFRVALRLGLTSFGGPVAHLGYFRAEYVARRHWLDEATFAELLAICQSLPGPASSQLGIAIGTLHAGIRGGVAAFVGFTAPSAIALVAFAALTATTDVATSGWLHGIRLVAVPIVALAATALAQALTPDWRRRAIALIALVAMLLLPGAPTQVGLIAAGAAGGAVLLHGREPTRAAIPVRISRRVALASLAGFAGMLVLLPIARAGLPPGEARQTVAAADAFYRSGALVFGGGHVVLPLLDQAVVAPGWVSQDRFLAGYGAAQAVPGPLFSFAAYLGWTLGPQPNGAAGALLALGAIFLPSFLLLFGVLPLWSSVGALRRAGGSLAGINAVVVGLLIAALYSPVWTSSVSDWRDVAVVGVDLLALTVLRAPSWLVVALSAVLGAAFLSG